MCIIMYNTFLFGLNDILKEKKNCYSVKQCANLLFGTFHLIIVTIKCRFRISKENVRLMFKRWLNT